MFCLMFRNAVMDHKKRHYIQSDHVTLRSILKQVCKAEPYTLWCLVKSRLKKCDSINKGEVVLSAHSYELWKKASRNGKYSAWFLLIILHIIKIV